MLQQDLLIDKVEQYNEKLEYKGLRCAVYLTAFALTLIVAPFIVLCLASDSAHNSSLNQDVNGTWNSTECSLGTLLPGNQCMVPWSDLKGQIRPTQAVLGFAWLQRKVNKNFQSSKDSQKEMDGEIIPLIRGPDGVLYLVDGHHTLGALDISSFHSVMVTVQLICDWSDLKETDFWQQMESNGFTYLYMAPLPDSAPLKFSPNDLPKMLDMESSPPSMKDDPWRSWAGFVRKVSL